LSGGQRQRVAMGRAIVRNPKVFLFDEPLSNLDAQLRVQMRAELKDLHARLRTTTIYVTHDQVEAMTMADRIVVMRAGRIEQVGAPLDLYDRPANTFVAQFIGSPSMNLLPARLERGADGSRLVLDGGAVLPLAPGRWQGAGESVTLGLRPEHLRLGGGAEGLAVSVLGVEATGADTTLTGRLGETRITALLRERAAVRAGERLSLVPDMASAQLFDTATGRRLD
jgi:multiple sugar transport system ATP-binding protein